MIGAECVGAMTPVLTVSVSSVAPGLSTIVVYAEVAETVHLCAPVPLLLIAVVNVAAEMHASGVMGYLTVGPHGISLAFVAALVKAPTAFTDAIMFSEVA
jgi:hypothetical protein